MSLNLNANSYLVLGSALDYNSGFTMLLHLRYSVLNWQGHTFDLYGSDSSNQEVVYTGPGAVYYQSRIGGTLLTTCTQSGLSTGNWYYVAIQRVSDTTTAMFFGTTPANVAQSGTNQTGSSVSSRAAAVATSMGRFPTESNWCGVEFAGMKLYQSVLTLQQIQTEFATLKPRIRSNLWGWWPFRTGDDLTDRSGQRGTWTPTGTPATSNGPALRWGGRGPVLLGPAGFPSMRQSIINGITSAQVEGAGWNAAVKPAIPVANVVRTSDTVVTITLPAVPAYDITAPETVTVTVPDAAHT